jgi:CRP-like cAMP-binding protein
MPVETFVKAYQEFPPLSRHVTNVLAIELALRLRANSSVRHTTTRTRLEQFVDECKAVARRLPKGFPPLRLKQTEIAQIVGSTPEHLNRLLHQMEGEGALDKTQPPFGMCLEVAYPY